MNYEFEKYTTQFLPQNEFHTLFSYPFIYLVIPSASF